MLSSISGGNEPAPPIRVRDLFALGDTTRFVVQDDYGRTTHTHWAAYRVGGNHESTINVHCGRVDSNINIPDAALDTVIRALENLRDARDRALAPVRFAEPLVEDEPCDPRVSADLGGALIDAVRQDPAEAKHVADMLDAQRGDSTDGGQVAA